MNIKFLLLEALRNLRANKGRSLLTILGILIGVSSVIMMTGIGLGVRRTLNSQLSDLGTDEIYIYEGYYSSEGMSAFARLTKGDYDAICSLPIIKDCSPEIGNSYPVVGEGGASATANLSGYSEAYYRNETLKLASGRNFTKSEVEGAAMVVLPDENAVMRLFPNDTPESVIGKKIKIRDLNFEIIGVLKNSSTTISYGNMIMASVPYTAMTLRLSPDRRINIASMIAFIDPEKTTAAEATTVITALLRERHSLSETDSDDFTIQQAQEYIESTDRISKSFVIFLGGVAAISLLVGGIGIMNIMLVVVSERTREIGLRKAIGAKKADILTQFLFESAILSLFGGFVGIFFGVLTSEILAVLLRSSGQGFDDFSVVISAPILFGALLFSAMFGLFFGFYPANRAAELQPVTALRSE